MDGFKYIRTHISLHHNVIKINMKGKAVASVMSDVVSFPDLHTAPT